MAVLSVEGLRLTLFERYGVFADQRLTDPTSDAPVIVDDRGRRDEDGRGNPLPWFCQMFAQAKALDCVQLTLRGDVPAAPKCQLGFRRKALEQASLVSRSTFRPATPENSRRWLRRSWRWLKDASPRIGMSPHASQRP